MRRSELEAEEQWAMDEALSAELDSSEYECDNDKELMSQTKAKVTDAGVAEGWIEDSVNRQFFPHRQQLPVIGNIPAGVYFMGLDPRKGFYLQGKNIASDRLIMAEGTAPDQMVREIRAFEDRKSEFAKRGFLHKRGILLCGEPGAGKSAAITMLSNIVTKELDGIVLYVTNAAFATNALPHYRALEPDRLFCAVLEDIDGMIGEEGQEEHLLSLLDGQNQVDNIVYIATTNYPENLPKRIWDRPSRFDTVLYVDLPNDELRAEFLRDKESSYTTREIEHAVLVTKGFTIAHLKEFIILNKCFGHGIDNAAKRINDIRNNTLFMRSQKVAPRL